MVRGKRLPSIRRIPLFGPVLGLALLLIPLSPAPLPGQTLEDRILEFLDASSGFQLLGDIRNARLRHGEETSVPVPLVEGAEYMVVAYCGAGCDNLDLLLVDDAGEVIQKDDLPDAEPVLMFTAESTGYFQVRVLAVEVSRPMTEVAVGVLASTAEPGMIPGEDMAGRLALVGAEFANLGFTEIGDEQVGSLNTDQTITLPITLQAGLEYRLVGVCDQDCFDLDLGMRDPSGEEVASDVLEDAIPILAHVADTTGEYQVGMTT